MQDPRNQSEEATLSDSNTQSLRDNVLSHSVRRLLLRHPHASNRIPTSTGKETGIISKTINSTWLEKPTSLTPVVQRTNTNTRIKMDQGFLRCVRSLLYLLAMRVNQFHHFSPRKLPMVWDELRVEGVGTWDHICLAQHLTVDTLLGPHKEKPCRAGEPESKEAKPRVKAKQHDFTKNLQDKAAHFIRFASLKLCKAQSFCGWMGLSNNQPPCHGPFQPTGSDFLVTLRPVYQYVRTFDQLSDVAVHVNAFLFHLCSVNIGCFMIIDDIAEG